MMSLQLNVTNLRARAENYVGRFFADHVNRAGNEKSRDAREYGCIHHTEPARLVNAKLAIEHTAIFFRPDGAGTGSVMPPGVFANELLEVVIGFAMFAREFFFGDQSLPLQFRAQPPYEADAIDHRRKVVFAAFAKEVEIDLGRIARIA